MLPARANGPDPRIAAALDGDRAAWQSLITEHGPRVWSLCRRLAREPEDAYQEVWERIHRKLHRFDPDRGSVRAWITTLTHRFLIDRHRRARVRGEVVHLGDHVDGPPSGYPADSALRDGLVHVRHAEAELDRTRRAAQLEQALQTLPDAQRRVVVFHHLAGRSLPEIADEEGVAVGTLKSRLHRARARLAELLGSQEKP